MSTITGQIRKADDELEQAFKIVENLHLQQPVLQDVINAANMAQQAAVTLNRLVGHLKLQNEMVESISKNQFQLAKGDCPTPVAKQE